VAGLPGTASLGHADLNDAGDLRPPRSLRSRTRDGGSGACEAL